MISILQGSLQKRLWHDAQPENTSVVQGDKWPCAVARGLQVYNVQTYSIAFADTSIFPAAIRAMVPKQVSAPSPSRRKSMRYAPRLEAGGTVSSSEEEDTIRKAKGELFGITRCMCSLKLCITDALRDKPGVKLVTVGVRIDMVRRGVGELDGEL